MDYMTGVRIHLSVRDTLSFNNMKGKAIRCMVETYSIDIVQY